MKLRTSIRFLMLAVLYVAIDAAAFHHVATAADVRLGGLVLILMTVIIPIGAMILWIWSKRDKSGNTLY